MAKRVMSLMLVLILCAGLAACGSSSSTAASDVGQEPANPKTEESAPPKEDSPAKADSEPKEEPLAEEGGPITVVDGIGNEFTFEKPITRAIVYDRFNTEVFRAIGATDVMIGIDQAAVNAYPEYWPGLGDTVQVIASGLTDYNAEVVAEVAPDAVFCCSLGEYESFIEQMKLFGIPVIIINAWIPAEYNDYIRLVAKVTGREEQGEEFIAFNEKMMARIREGVASIPESERKTVYYESNAGEYKTALPGSGWHDMVVSAGGINIFGDITELDPALGSVSAYDIDPEALIEADPDVIIRIIAKTQQHDSLSALLQLDPSELRSELESLVDRPAWNTLKAVQDGTVYCFTPFLGNINSKLNAIVYVATWLYPETFADVDPDEYLDQTMRYMGFDTIRGHTANLLND